MDLNGVAYKKPNHSAEFRRCLTDLDVPTTRKLWRHVFPHLTQPANDHDTLMTIHMVRTQAPMIELRQRAYSHRWLIDNGYPSALPDHLKPAAERLYPRVVDAVGISVNSKSSVMQPVAVLVQTAMEDTVSDAYSNRIRPPDDRIHQMMMDARVRTIKKLIGK